MTRPHLILTRALIRVAAPALTVALAVVLASASALTAQRPQSTSSGRTYLDLYRTNPVAPTPAPVGTLSRNPFLSGSTASPTVRYDADSPANPYGRYGSPYSDQGARNPYTNGGLRIYGDDGTYLGRLNANRYDPESVSNPYGRYGSPHSPTSIRNPYSRYGSPYSSSSATNPFATSPPQLYAPSSSTTRSPRITPIQPVEPVQPVRPGGAGWPGG